jgi:ATP-binding cassette, subfamily B, bacterial MsbA
MTTRDIMQRIWERYLVNQRGLLGMAAICAVIVAITTGLIFKWLQPAIDLFFPQGAVASEPLPNWITAHPFLMIPAVMIGLSLIRLFAQLGMATSVNKAGHGLVGRVQSELFSNLVHADLGHLQKAHSGQYLSSVLFDAGLMREAATNGLINYLQHGLIVVSSLAVMAWTDWTMTLGVLICGPIVALVLSAYNKRTKKAAQGVMTETSSLSTAIMESLDGIKIVKVSNQEAFEEARVNGVISRRQAHVIKGANARASAAPATELITQSVIALVIVYAGWRSHSGGLSAGDFITFIAALGGAGQSLRQLANLQTVMAEGFTAARRLFAALDIEPEIADDASAPKLKRDFKRLEFKNVGFAYAAGKPVLKDVSFSVESGQSVALVGPSGSGKSTLLNLLPRFYDLTHGSITFDGTDHRSLGLKSLRDQMALVTQDPFLFDDTIAANIAYGKRGATDDEIERAASDAAAHDFILSLPQGYQTRVGEAGSRLSGGQKQRIAIARAFLKDAPLLLLDEATSALDSQSEILIQEALTRLMKGRLSLTIAHRLSTIKHADLILVLEAGKVVERGTHEALLANGGLYAALAQSQFAPAEAVAAR